MSTISLVVCFIIIVVTAWIYFTPTARHHLDRISFRLLLCVMVLEIGYDSAWIALFHAVRHTKWNQLTSSGRYTSLVKSHVPLECSPYLGLWLRRSECTCRKLIPRINYLCACIAINLSLTIVFNVNPKKWRKAARRCLGHLLTG